MDTNNIMSNDNNDNNMCANCGKGEEESINLKKCGACKMVRYCSAACQHAHRPQHKKECRKRAAELHEEALFRQPLLEDCPICFLRLSRLHTGTRYISCCGKTICGGCIHAGGMTDNDQLCPFCRALVPKLEEEILERTMERVEVDDAQAMYQLGCCYAKGVYGLPQDHAKALELWHRAGKLGGAFANHNIGFAYLFGRGVERDVKKAKHYFELAAIGGNVEARHNLGSLEGKAGNTGRALKHFMIAAEGGYDKSLKTIQQMYSKGYATKEDYAKALRAYQAYLAEIKSDQRDKAAAFSEEYRYY